MSICKQEVAYYLACLRDGMAEIGFFGLIEAGPDAVSLMIAAFDEPENRAVRANIVRCVWEYRLPEALGFLAAALHDPEPQVWKEALDGIVALGGSEAARTLEAARTRVSAAQAEWIEEALEQLREQTKNTDHA